MSFLAHFEVVTIVYQQIVNTIERLNRMLITPCFWLSSFFLFDLPQADKDHTFQSIFHQPERAAGAIVDEMFFLS